MSEPKRIQRKRSKGWRMPDGAVYVGRPTRWGNPFRVGDTYGPVYDCEPIRHAGQAVLLFSGRRARAGYPSNAEVRLVLAGRDLACWCRLDQPCHADVLLAIAND